MEHFGLLWVSTLLSWTIYKVFLWLHSRLTTDVHKLRRVVSRSLLFNLPFSGCCRLVDTGYGVTNLSFGKGHVENSLRNIVTTWDSRTLLKVLCL